MQGDAAIVPPSGSVSGPGFDTEIGLDGEGPIGPDGWYDVSPDGETGSSAQPDITTGSTAPPPLSASEISQAGAGVIRDRVYIGLGVMLILALALVFSFWRRRRLESIQPDADGPSLAYGVHTVIKQTGTEDDASATEPMDPVQAAKPEPTAAPAPPPPPVPPSPPPPEPAHPPASEPTSEFAPIFAPPPAPKPEHAPAPSAQPVTPQPTMATSTPRLDLALEMVGGSRSVMMFSVDFRLDLANRDDNALRDVTVLANLACAQSAAANATPLLGGTEIAKIERIGPQQSHRVGGQLQLPLNQVKAIKQGAKPLFIPLLHIRVVRQSDSAGEPATIIANRSFVVGTPSTTSQTRVHPLPLDGPPGGLPNLRAQLIKQPTPA
ncbi:MAG: hypothetical protein ABJN35_01705 [Erythrobacter sp.]